MTPRLLAWWGSGALLTTVGLLTACVDDDVDGNRGDGTSAVAYQDVVHRTHSDLAEPPASTTPLGEGDIVDRDDRPVGSVSVHAIDGVDPEVAVVVPKPAGMNAIYVDEDLSPREWPEERSAVLGNDRLSPARCDRPPPPTALGLEGTIAYAAP